MEKGEISNTTSVRIVVNNFKTNEDLKNLLTRFGRNMFGKGRRLRILEVNTTRVKIGSGKPSMFLS